MSSIRSFRTALSGNHVISILVSWMYDNAKGMKTAIDNTLRVSLAFLFKLECNNEKDMKDAMAQRTKVSGCISLEFLIVPVLVLPLQTVKNHNFRSNNKITLIGDPEIYRQMYWLLAIRGSVCTVGGRLPSVSSLLQAILGFNRRVRGGTRRGAWLCEHPRHSAVIFRTRKRRIAIGRPTNIPE